jgi:hypothetical protein
MAYESRHTKDGTSDYVKVMSRLNMLVGCCGLESGKKKEGGPDGKMNFMSIGTRTLSCRAVNEVSGVMI